MGKVWGTRYTTSDMTDTTIFCPVKSEANYILKAARVQIIIFNDPAFTNLNLKIYSNDSNDLPKKLLHTSTNTQDKGDIHTENNAIKEIYFDFNNVLLRNGDRYNFVINGTGYTGDENKNIAWRKSFPESHAYTSNIENTLLKLNPVNLGVLPYVINFIGVELK